MWHIQKGGCDLRQDRIDIANELGIVVEILSYGYAIVIVDENMIQKVIKRKIKTNQLWECDLLK